MSYFLRVDDAGRRIECVHDGRLSISEIRAAQRDSADWLSQHSLDNLLVDLRECEINDVSFLDLFTVNTTHTFVFRSSNLRLAFLVVDHQFETMAFAETVARNRGTDCRVFLDRDEAIRWLSATERGWSGG